MLYLRNLRDATRALGAACLLTALGACASHHGARGGAPSAESPGLTQRLDAVVSKAADNGTFSGTVLVGRDGEVVYKRHAGLESFESGLAVDDETRFRVFSTTKQFTAAGVMILEDDGALSLSDSVRRFFPEAPESWEPVTIGHLLRHTSGIPVSEQDFVDKVHVRQADTVGAVLTSVQDRPLASAPGERFAYSNAGYTILGGVIERASGIEYERFIERRVFEPAGMESSGFHYAVFDAEGTPGSDIGAGYLPGLATGYKGRPGALCPTVAHMYIIQGAGGMVSTAEDLWRYNLALRSGTVLSGATQARMVAEPFAASETTRVACGWFIRERSGRTMTSHSGGNNGFTSEFARLPEEDLCVVVLCNLGFGSPEALRDELLEVLLGD